MQHRAADRFTRFERDFVDHLDSFEPRPPDVTMTLHRQVCQRRARLTAAEAVQDGAFLRAAWDAAAASDEDGYRRMVPYRDFEEGMNALGPEVAALDGISLAAATPSEIARAGDLLGRVPARGSAPWIARSVALHHVLPDLVTPMGTHTLRVLDRDGATSPACDAVLADLAELARLTRPERYVGRNAYCTSATQVLDNALVGFVGRDAVSGFADGLYQKN